MELRHLRYFLAAAEEENISRAALKLHVSQPALSRQIRDLEDELGVQLLERGAKSVRLTEAGRIFSGEVREVLLRTDQAVQKTRAVARSESTELPVGYAPSLTVQILPKALRAFQKEAPSVRVILHDLSTEEMLVQLRNGTLQLALLVQPTPAMLRGLTFEEIARYPMCLAVPTDHPLARLRSVSVTQVAGESLIGYSRSGYPEYHEFLQDLFSSLPRPPRLLEEHDGVSSLIAAVESGRGAALAPSCLSCMVGPRLKLLPIKPEPAPVVVGAAWRKGTLPSLSERFLDAVRVSRNQSAVSSPTARRVPQPTRG